MSRFLVSQSGHSVALTGTETQVGSDPAADIPVRAEMGVLPWHFVIAPLNGHWHLIAGQGATVLVNGFPVHTIEIHDGDQIVAGQLEVTYRNDQEANAAISPFSSPVVPAAAAGPVPVSVYAAVPMRRQETDGGQDSTSSQRPDAPALMPHGNIARPSGGKHDPFWLMLIGLILLLGGGYVGYTVWKEPVKRLKLDDLTIVEVLIKGATLHEESQSLNWTELHTNLQTARPIELPPDMHYVEMWSQPGSVARIGFEKASYESPPQTPEATQARLWPVTLSVNGVSFRSLDKHNQVIAGQTRLLRTACPVAALIGLIIFVHGREKGRARREQMRYG